MGIHENASSSSLRVESNLSAAPFNVFQRIEKKKLLMNWVVCIKFKGLKMFLIFFLQSEKRGKPEWSCAKMKDLVFSFPRSWICLIWAKVFPKDDRRTLAKPTQEWSVINSKGSLALKTELYPKSPKSQKSQNPKIPNPQNPQGWLAHFGKTHPGMICD